MSNWEFLNRHRVASGHYASTPADGFNGAFQFKLMGARLNVIASDGEGWQHVSVSIERCMQPPAWSVMCAVKDLFWEEDQTVVQYHPSKAEYVNFHPGCLHLWRPTTQTLPIPPRLMV